MGEDLVGSHHHVPHQHRQLVEPETDRVAERAHGHLDQVFDELQRRADLLARPLEQRNEQTADVVDGIRGVDPTEVGRLQ